MGQAVPTQHPAVVLRSHYRHLRALLAIAMIAVVGLTVAVVILATDDGATSARSAAPLSAPAEPAAGPRDIHSPGQRYDGGPEEGTRGAVSLGAPSSAVPETRYDGGPEEGTRGSGR